MSMMYFKNIWRCILVTLIIGACNLTIDAQISLHRFESGYDHKVRLGIEDNRNVLINYRLNHKFSVTASSTARFERLGSNYYRLAVDYNFLNAEYFFVNGIVNFASQYFTTENAEGSGQIELFGKLKGIRAGVNTGFSTREDRLLLAGVLGYYFNESYSIYTVLGEKMEFNYIYSSLDIGVSVKKENLLVRGAISRPKIDGRYLNRNTRILLSMSLDIK